MNLEEKHIIISRTDSIGDVVLTLPLAGIIKTAEPNCKITFLGRTYTKAIVGLSEHIDAFLNWDELEARSESDQIAILKALNADAIVHVFPNKAIAKLAKRAAISMRIGTSHRSFHLLTCNHRPNFSRRKSELHEAQLNVKLLAPLGINHIPPLEVFPSFYGFSKVPSLPEKFKVMLSERKLNIILHPKSKGSAIEWGLPNFMGLIEALSNEKHHIFITGTAAEGERIKKEVSLALPNVTDLTGSMSLDELVAFIAQADALVACSTGPLHIAAALGKKAIGLFSERKPIHPGRWSPLGTHAISLTHPSEEKMDDVALDQNIQKITPKEVMQRLLA